MQVQKAIIRKDDKYLILLRSPKSNPFPEHWDFPGGKLESGESPSDGIIREAKEETRLDIIPDRVVFEYEMTINNRPVKFFVYSIKSFSGQVALSYEHSAFKWATKDEILALEKIEPYLVAYLQSI